jgi:molybdate/tungstate transport system substrate-binding protein
MRQQYRPSFISVASSGLVLAVAIIVGWVAVAAASAQAGPPVRATLARASGEVDVISAGSLQTLMTKIAPAFKAATGYKLVDTSGGSSSDAADIKDKVDVEDVFVSASPAVDATLEGAKNGSWVSWYGSFAASPEVLGYYPKSKFAKDLKTMPWYKVITLPGFRLGRTDPTQDPGGVLAVKALEQTAKAQHLPALAKLATETSDEYVEDTEEAAIQTGQLDASFMYEADANSQASPFVKLTGTDLAGDYTITIVKNAPHVAAAEAFIKFLLGSKGQAAMRADHFQIVSPAKLSGSGVPAALASLFK